MKPRGQVALHCLFSEEKTVTLSGRNGIHATIFDQSAQPTGQYR